MISLSDEDEEDEPSDDEGEIFSVRFAVDAEDMVVAAGGGVESGSAKFECKSFIPLVDRPRA